MLPYFERNYIEKLVEIMFDFIKISKRKGILENVIFYTQSREKTSFTVLTVIISHRD